MDIFYSLRGQFGPFLVHPPHLFHVVMNDPQRVGFEEPFKKLLVLRAGHWSIALGPEISFFFL